MYDTARIEDLAVLTEVREQVSSGECAAGALSGEASLYGNYVREATAFIQPFAICVLETCFMRERQCLNKV